MQYCYSNFSFIEDVVKMPPNRGVFKQKKRSNRGDVVVSAPSKGAFLAPDLERQLISQKKAKNKIISKILEITGKENFQAGKRFLNHKSAIQGVY
jgi:hypothetical protein